MSEKIDNTPIVLDVSGNRPKDFAVVAKDEGETIQLPKNYFIRITKDNKVHTITK